MFCYTVESRFLKPPDISKQTLFPLDLPHSSSIISPPIFRTLDFSKLPITRTNFSSRGTNSNLRKFRNNLVWMSITSTPLNKLTLPDKLFSHNKQATNLSSVCKVQWLPRITEQKFPYLIVFLKLLPQYIDKFRCLLTQCELRHAISVPVQPPKWCA